jgi:hypothetical protein
VWLMCWVPCLDCFEELCDGCLATMELFLSDVLEFPHSFRVSSDPLCDMLCSFFDVVFNGMAEYCLPV